MTNKSIKNILSGNPSLGMSIRGHIKTWINKQDSQGSNIPEPFALHSVRICTEADRAEEIYKNSHYEQARIRTLPYPFKYFITINSDCDSINMDGLLNTAKIIREQYGLPVADSIFPKWLYLRGLQAGKISGENNAGDDNRDFLRCFARQNFEWIRAFSKGATDTVHGWIPRMRIKIARDFTLGWQSLLGQWLENKLAQPGQGILVTGLHRLLQWPVSRLRRKKRLRFIVPPSWHRKEPPRYFYFEASLPYTGRWFEIHISTATGISQTVSSASLVTGKLGFNAYIVDLVELLNVDPRDLNDIRIEFELKGGRIGNLYVRRPTLLSDTRADIKRHIRCMQAFNILFTTYTSHGGGYDIGRQNSPELMACDPRIIAEYPENPHYALDIFRNCGMDFFNTASNTSANAIQNINNLTYPNVLNDGSVIYDFTRFLSFVPKDMVFPEDNVEASVVDPSYSEAAGRQIFASINRMTNEGDGALIYTHLLVKGLKNKDRGNHNVDKLLNSDTHAALAMLAEKYYGITKNRDEERIWISSTAVLLRYSQVIQGIGGHVFYDVDNNSVNINPWRDYVLDRMIPDMNFGVRELRGLTFYVRDSHTARLFVGGREFDCLIRNPADETGMESITIADVESPLIVSGRTFWQECHELEPICEQIILFSSEKGTGLALESNNGSVILKKTGCSLAHYQYVSFRFCKSDPALRFRIDLMCDNNLVLGIVEEGFQDPDGAYIIKAYEDTGSHTVILPYHYLLGAVSPSAQCIPSSQLRTIRILLQGSNNQNFVLENLQLLRDCDLPHDGSHLIGGNVGDRKDIQQVHVKGVQKELVTKPFPDGNFLFPDKFTRGEIYEIKGLTGTGDEIFPITGRYIELYSNNLDILF